jgi:hypothetical protein
MNDITYGRLHCVLTEMGFQLRESTPNVRIYLHPDTGAKLYYPVADPSALVLPHHLAATRMSLDQFVIASPSEFEGWLQRTAD